ncbi:hypothetical protein HUN08_14865 [Gordonia sp. X0973]|uniref:hypothetical protein n=1 Tax=Gordonia sp. X0973 TaxID=2742602 RepID=UPI001583CD45|nr:hypothetical protein [Gordonia sp. X0973]QKT08336.1 hypothetical protein HUN08_14865 [Gordonia sp. X0973]
MTRTATALAALVLTAGVVVSGCSSSTTETKSPEDLKSSIPVPAGVTRTVGPDPIASNGIRMHYEATGAPGPSMVAYRNALRDKGWAMTTIVTSEGGTGGGATYVGSQGNAYTVVDGGGFEQQTFIDICVWPEKPAEPNCTRAKR